MKKLLIALLGLLLSLCCSAKSLPVESLAERVTLGTSKGRIVFALKSSDTDKDWFEISSKGKKVLISGNSDLSLSVGLDWYLKYVAGIHICWNNLRQPLPKTLPLPKEKIRHSTSLKDRYYLNYCTHSYSMAYWDWDRWEKEIDWMALHGVNMPLAITGVETLWRNLLLRCGYTKDEANDFISGPGFMAWWLMNNLEGWGGPNPDSWYDQREELGRKIVSRMRELGMEPVLPGYSGMVPRNAKEKLGFDVFDPGIWCCGFPRPCFLLPNDEHFAPFAAMYYQELEKLFGKSKYYSMDPFHEDANTQGMDLAAAGKVILGAMKEANPEAVWVAQAWQDNPKHEMIAALEKGDMKVLDLYSETTPRWGDPTYIDPKPKYRRSDKFCGHDWLYCELLNFGGNVGLHGRMNSLVKGFYDALELSETLTGVGLTPEGIENNPMMFELLTELPWRGERFDPDTWMQEYLKARYGGELRPEVLEAWRAIEHTAYNAPVDYPGQGTVESLLCARPGLHLTQTSSCGKSILFYPADSTAKAAALMSSAKSHYEGNNNFDYDLVDINRQANADRANVLSGEFSKAFDKRDLEKFHALSSEFLALLLAQDELLSSRKEFSLNTWLDAAQSLGSTLSEQQLYRSNAATIITVWGNEACSEKAWLHEYSHREWSGILRDLYYERWKAFFEQKEAELRGLEVQPIDYYAMEKAWVERVSIPTTE